MHELAQKYTGKLVCEVKNHDAGDSPARIQRYGLNIHGMVITGADDKVLWSESSHKQTREGVEAAIAKVLGG